MIKAKKTKIEVNDMFWLMALAMGVLWGLGLWSGYTLGGAVHLLLTGAVVMTLLGLRQWWRRPV